MNKVTKYIIIGLCFLLVFSCKTQGIREISSPIRRDLLFKNVNIISMVSEDVIKNQSVLISNGIIQQIGAFDDLNLSTETVIINAEGQYLLPGFNDMHAHVWNPSELSLFLANGVTTIRNMWGAPEHIQAREQIKNGDILGPNLFTAGPLTDGRNPYWSGSHIIDDPAQVEDYVKKVKAEGYDFIKVYDNLSFEVFEKIMEVSKTNNIPVIGHVPNSTQIGEAINWGMQSIEHFEGYELRYSLQQLSKPIELTIESGVWNCPTLLVQQTYTELTKRYLYSDKYTKESIPELKYIDPQIIKKWDFSGGYSYRPQEAKALLGELYQKGANIVSGSDPYNPYIVAGFSLHKEFELMYEAGLSSYEVLLTSTVNPAKMLGIEDKAGTVEVGKNADLVLLEKNPLEDISNTKSISGVVIQGQWLDRISLDAMFNQVEEYYLNIGSSEE